MTTFIIISDASLFLRVKSTSFSFCTLDHHRTDLCDSNDLSSIDVDAG